MILQRAANRLNFQPDDDDLDIPPLKEFAKMVMPELDMYWYVELMFDCFQKIGDGELHRLMVFMPPRHGKSICSDIAIAWFLLRRKGFSTITASYAAKRAEANSKSIQRFFTAGGGKLFTKPPSEWMTTDGSELRAVGVGGGVSGFDGHLLWIDDPISGARDSQSVVMQHRLEDWFYADFLTRQTQWSEANPEVPVVIVQTLWSDLELSMQIVEREREFAADPDTRDLCEQWHVLCFPALYTKTPRTIDWPDTFVVYPDPRTEEGEPLAPARRTEKELRKIRARLINSGREWMWNALYQQDPKPPTGTLIKREWFKKIKPEDIPPITRWYRGWDLAFTESKRKSSVSDLGVMETDYTASVLCGLGIDRKVYFKLDVLEKQGPAAVRQTIEDQVALDPPGTVVCIERAHAGLAIIDEIRAHGRLSEVEIHEVRPGSRNKLARAMGWITRASRGELVIIEDSDGKDSIDLAETWLRCVTAFRNQDGDFDDPVDAMSTADEVMSQQYGEERDPYETNRPTVWEYATGVADPDDDEDDW